MNLQGIEFATLGFVSIGVTIAWDSDKNRKTVVFPKRWTSATIETQGQFFSRENNGIALLTGDKSDLIVIDCDVLKEKDVSLGVLDGVEIFQALIDKFGVLNCPIAKSTSGGRHYFFSLSKSLEKGLQQTKNTSKIVVTKGLLDPQRDCKSITVDTRGDGGCIIVAPTKFLKKSEEVEYKWTVPLVASNELPAMPDWCIRLLNESVSSSSFGPKCRKDTVVDKTFSKLVSTTMVFFDHSLFIKQTSPKIKELQQSEISKTWDRSKGFDYALQDQSKPCVCCLHVHTSNNYMVREVCDSCFWMKSYSSKCKKSGFVYNWESHPLLQMVLESPSTDAPYTKMLYQRYLKMGFELVFTLQNRFLNFNGIVWEELPEHVVAREIEAICCPILDYLVKFIPPCKGNDDEIIAHKALIRRFAQGRNYLRKSSNVRSIATYFKMMHTDIEIEEKLDSNPNLLAVRNGIIDLRTGGLREGRRDDFCFIQLDTVFEPNGSTAMIDELVNDLFNHDKEFIHYFQKLFGYAITGHTKEQIFTILTGEGANGKSLWMGIVDALLENLCVTASYDVFFKNDRRGSEGAATPHIMALKGSRICVKEETEPKDKLNVEILKMVTGESKVSARQLHGKQESFMPSCLPILLCNHKPAIDIEDPALTRRIVVVPFDNIYTSADDSARPFNPDNPRHRLKNTDLRTKLLTSFAQEQLLTWLVQGSVKWFKEGLGKQPESVKDAFSKYKDENDRIKIFIEDRCELPPSGIQKSDSKEYHINAGDFLKALNESSNIKYLQKDLIPQMDKKGFKYTNLRSVSGRVFTGLRFNPE